VKRPSLQTLLSRFRVARDGATSIEYGLIVALIFLVIVASVTLVANETTDMFIYVSNSFSSATASN
jgi:pilus assembly protein Flp/PilA